MTSTYLGLIFLKQFRKMLLLIDFFRMRDWGHPQLFEKDQQLTALHYRSGREILPKRSG
jgi:hypothetical protein